MERINNVGVVGCGTMGSGICEVVARGGKDITFVELTDEMVEGGLNRITNSLQRAVDREQLTPEEMDEILSHIAGSTDFAALADCDLVVEAVPEVLSIKQDTFRKLDGVLRDDAIVATNTSSLGVIDVAVHTKRPDRVLGFHFFNPAPVMELVEMITTVVTNPEVVALATTFAEELGKTPVVVRDRAGFIANLLLFPYLNQAVGMVEEGYATREDIDAAMKLGTGHPIGPIGLVDLIGIDSTNSIMERMYEQFGDVRYAPKPIIRQLKSAGFLGRKTGRGFYSYIKRNTSKVAPGDASDVEPVDAGVIDGWSTIGVLGSGTMAAGIAEVCAKAGYDVVLRGRSVEKAQAAKASVGRSMARMVDKGRMEQAVADEALAHITPTDGMAAFADCDLVIEAVAEQLEVKQPLFEQLDQITGPDCVLATTTSSLPVVELAMATGRPEKVVGLHFFNPAAIMKLVEVVPTVRTDDTTLMQARAITEALGKHAVLCGDRAGFIVNALLFPYLNDSIRMLEDGYATVTEIDTAMKLGCAHPMGPFELMDIVGLDVTLEICRALHAEFRDPGFAPVDLLEQMVGVGYLGRKVGRGFYTY
ncbi:3-hydroxyacyl-CoA dehydrogenase family protein [Euzebya tangerina]|uniref:3-hydroxyacyl-CoA dehydrogenase family protein n=1 Tax=Euzebya tangerina TaxID=591198 RepID=UPI00196AE585|nr:3-hydroxybutyryl-CoA dehydrogenase [Euzebya tangerina]